MSDFVPCVGLFILALLAPFIWLIVRAIQSQDQIKALQARLKTLEAEFKKLQAHMAAPIASEPLAKRDENVRPAAPILTDERSNLERLRDQQRERAAAAERLGTEAAKSILEPQAAVARSLTAPDKQSTPAHAPAVTPPKDAAPNAPAIPTSAPVKAPTPTKPAQPAVSIPEINWEKFLGVKMFAWVGGLALFLGAAFFIKYAFDNNLISPEARVALGYLFGIGLMAGGLWLSREKSAVTVQTLCATATVILYTNTFAAHEHYHLFGTTATFCVMALTTAFAFFLAVRLDARVVAILGLLGGFVTPLVVSTGVDNPLGLFGYLALLDIGLVAVALRKRWTFMLVLAAGATVFMQAGWTDRFFGAEKVYTGMAIFLGFSVLFALALAVADRLKRADNWVNAAAIIMPSSALVFALVLIVGSYPTLAARPGLIFGFVLLVDLTLLAVAWLRTECRMVLVWAGAAAYLLLAAWTFNWIKPDLLNAALGFYLLFALLHSVFPLVLQRLRPAPMPLWTIHFFPMLALLLILVPLNSSAELSWLLWPVVLAVDLLAVVLAVLTTSLLSILAVFVLTIVATAMWMASMPVSAPDLSYELVVIGAFAVFFLAAIVWSARRVKQMAASVLASGGATPGATAPGQLTPDSFNQLASISAVMPFLLLSMVLQQMKLADPSPVFGLAAFLALLLLSVAVFCEVEVLSLIALGGVLLVEFVWHAKMFSPQRVQIAIIWHLALSALFLIFPFAFIHRLKERTLPWIASALSLPLHFFLIYDASKAALPSFGYMGVIPASLAVPSLVGLFILVRSLAADSVKRTTLLALFGGAALFFITFIFPIQFEKQWLTVGWALEGVALLWLFRRVPHIGLTYVGFLLLITSFARLALNPFVISDYGRSGTPIFNWYLYTYGIVSVCLFAGGYLLAPPRNTLGGSNVRPVPWALGVILAFLLLNIEIADYFSKPGPVLTLDFDSTFAQDMAYSLGWAAFSFILLGVGFRSNNAPVRYAGMGLMVVTIIKLFLHDLWQLGGLYRIGSLVGLAVVLMLISFIYQRFLSKPAEPKTPTQ